MFQIKKAAYRHHLSFLLLVCLLAVSGWGIRRAFANEEQRSVAESSLSGLLNPDGTLDLSRGFTGSLNPQGFRMEYAENGAPRFVPAAPTAGEIWDPQFVNANGAQTFGYAVAVIGTDVYVGGSPLVTAGSIGAGGIAKWDGSSRSTLGNNTLSGSVYTLAVNGSNLYVGGDFSVVTQTGTTNDIAVWNGSNWLKVGSGISDANSYVLGIAVSGSDLYIGGQFSSVSGVLANNIARWNGSAWSALGSGTDSRVAAVAVSGSNVYAGGEFSNAGGNAAGYIACWNGSAWSALGSGMNSFVQSLAISGTNVFAGGNFSTAGGVSANGIARWNGSAWSALGSGLLDSNSFPANVRSLLIIGESLYAAGTIATAGGTPANGIARWSGTWSALGSGLASGAFFNPELGLSIAALGSDLYVAGNFSKAGGSEANRIARWNGSTWSPLGNTTGSVNRPVYAVAVNGTDVYVGGEFDFAGGVAANNIAKWNGSAWSALGSGLNSAVKALVVSGTNVYAGGHFTTAGGNSANRVARWNGSTWSALGSGITNAAAVTSLAVIGTNVYAGGTFFTAGGNPVNSIARWNGSAWSALGSGLNGFIDVGLAMAVIGTDLYVGGNFSDAGGVANTANIARWNGSAWSALGSGTNGAVRALAVSGNDLYAGGSFTTAGGNSANIVAKWNGSAWSALGAGVSGGAAYALAAVGNDLYVGGNFSQAGDSLARNLAKWNGSSWSAPGGIFGIDNTIHALGLQGTTLFAGGDFTQLGGVRSHFFGRFACGAITLSPNTLPNGAVGATYNQTLTASPSGSYTFSIITGSLPKGLTLSSGGVISGTPAEFGIFNFTVMAGSGSCMGSRAYTLTVTGTACATPNFTNRADFTGSNFPIAIITGDFNKDGKADLATSNLNTSDLSVMLGNGLGGFPTITNVAVANGVGGLATGDFNSDGNLDLVVTSLSSNLSVLFGNGSGGFPTSISVNVGANQSAPRIGDFNGDGKLDLLVITGTSLQVRLGDGAGNFSVAPGSPLTLGFAPAGFTTLNDFNLDGKLDLAIGQNGAAQVSVLYGAGDGSFAAGSPISVSSTPTNVGSADFNLDGNADLAVSHTNDSLTILLGNGAGGFSTAAGSPISGAAAFLPGDFNGDGIPDLAAQNRVAYGNGSGGFTLLNNLDTGSDRRAVTYGEFNGDGKPDLAVVNTTPNRVVVVLNNCAPSMVAAAPLTRQQGSPAINAFIGTVSDVETPAGSLFVSPRSLPTGINVTNIVNNNGTVTADVIAGCNAPPGALMVQMEVGDGILTANVNLTVNVTANTPPVLTYPATPISVANGGSTTINPLTGPGDNGSVTSVNAVSATFIGTLSVNSAGVVSISNAGPGGTHTINVTATDNCNSTVTVPITVTVGCFNSLTVNSLGDGADAVPGNNVCETAAGNGVCTLRAALQEAHAQLACSPFTINLAVTGTINLNSALPNIRHPDLTLNGPGAQQLAVRSNAAPNFTIFNVDDNSTSVKKLTVNGLTLRDGLGAINGSAGSQITVNDCVVTNNGFGIGNGGTSLTINNSAIVGNPGAGELVTGVGVANGTLTMTNSVISGNGVSNTQESALIVLNATATLTNCTISGNAGYETITLSNLFPANITPTLTLTNCTVTGNTLNSPNTAYGVLGLNESGPRTIALQLKNTLVANNTLGLGANFRIGTGGTVTSLGNNLDSDGSSGFTNGVNGNLVGTVANPINALLAPLGNYGGTTQTIALLPGSPAINAGTATGAPANDQRGIARVGNPDIGAFESRGFTLAASGGNNQSTPVNTAFANPLSVTVGSAFSEPVDGGRVTFTPPGTGASATIAGTPATITGGTAGSGTVTANSIVGAYNVAASANGATPINFALTNLNTAPSFTPAAAVTRQQGSTAGAAVIIGTVADAQTAAGSLIVTQIAGGTTTGVNISGITNTGGTITAVVTADCNAVGGTVRFQVSDGELTGTGELTVNVSPNSAPAVNYAAAAVNAGSATTNSPTTATDNGSINSFAVQSQGTYTGTISVNASGVVSISNAAPVGNHTITVRATDNCGATTDATFTLTVGNNLPTITPAAALTRQQGSAGSISTIAAV
ncbi:MAG TPA: FG-GAP-like repeat-containing protein, partial [Blastocatellia bacterium]|nr:FG-GAP-like repeat-containing protein [Blastocatellia bacterium]